MASSAAAATAAKAQAEAEDRLPAGWFPWFRQWLFWPAVVMSLGWALRGYIGGGPLGAMIPGALVAMVLLMLLRPGGGSTRNTEAATVTATVAAFGAIGIGLGGQMTYGQTIGLALGEATRTWGLLGLALKGGIWGLLGNGVLALGLLRPSLGKRTVALCLALVAVGAQAGWKLVNEPKLIYFSNLLDRPRKECWAGLLLAALLVLLYLQWQRPQAAAVVRGFAWRGLVCGAIGFGLGGYIQVLGKGWSQSPLIGYWKQMELFFGAMLGLGLGWSAWRFRAMLAGQSGQEAEASPGPGRQRERGEGDKKQGGNGQGGKGQAGIMQGRIMQSVLSLALVGLALVAQEAPWQMSYTFVGMALLGMVLRWPWLGWQVAITLTFAAFWIDFVEARPDWGTGWVGVALWAAVSLGTLAVAWWLTGEATVRSAFGLLLASAVANSLCKSFLPPPKQAGENLLAMEALFVGMMAVSWWLARPAAGRTTTRG